MKPNYYRKTTFPKHRVVPGILLYVTLIASLVSLARLDTAESVGNTGAGIRTSRALLRSGEGDGLTATEWRAPKTKSIPTHRIGGADKRTILPDHRLPTRIPAQIQMEEECWIPRKVLHLEAPSEIWMDLNPEYQHHLLVDESSRWQYLLDNKNHHDSELLLAYQNVHPSMEGIKKELFQYLWLAVEGGFVAVTDEEQEALPPLRDFLDCHLDSLVVTAEGDSPLAASSHHPVIRTMLELWLQRWKKIQVETPILQIHHAMLVGEDLLQKAFQQVAWSEQRRTREEGLRLTLTVLPRNYS